MHSDQSSAIWICSNVNFNYSKCPEGLKYPGQRHFLKYKNSLSLWLDIRQNQWPMKYSHWLTYILRGQSFVSHWSITQIQYFSIKLSSRYEAKSLDHKIYVTDLHILDEVNLCVTLIHYTMMFIHLTILKMLSKITRPWNIGHVDLYLIWGQSLGHTVSLSESMTLIHQIFLEIYNKITRPWNIGHSDLHLL